MKIATIVGTRPQYVKIDPSIPGQIFINTGQHYDRSLKEDLLRDIGIKKFDYECETTKLSPMIHKISTILKKERPSCVLLYGDCRSTLAGAIAAHELSIPIVHVEAGMRSYRHDMPEERIRVIVDHMAHLLLVPDVDAGENLEREGIFDGVFVVGNTMFDTFNDVCPIPPSKDKGTYSYLSIHRQENKESKVRLESIFEGIEASGEQFLWPIHPATASSIKDMKITVPENIKCVPPLGYKKNIERLANARRVLTDSGGIQSEAYWLGVPCGVLRKQTEWKGYVADGWSLLLDADSVDIELFLKKKFKLAAPRPHMPRFGAKKRIQQILQQYYGS